MKITKFKFFCFIIAIFMMLSTMPFNVWAVDVDETAKHIHTVMIAKEKNQAEKVFFAYSDTARLVM